MKDVKSEKIELVDYEDYLHERLRDDKKAARYLRNAIESDSRRELLVALNHVVKARSSYTEVAKKMGIARESLHRMLTAKGNPTLSNFIALIEALGFGLELVEARPKKKRA